MVHLIILEEVSKFPALPTGRRKAMAQKYTEARKAGNRKWDAANLDRISIAAPKGTKERWKAAAVTQGKSMNQFIVEAVDNQISQDRRKDPSEAREGTSGAGWVYLPSEQETARETAQNGATAKED